MSHRHSSTEKCQSMTFSLLVLVVKCNCLHFPYRIHVEGSADGQGIELVFRSITPEDSGNYACEATLEGVVERAEFELKVIGEWTEEEK